MTKPLENPTRRISYRAKVVERKPYFTLTIDAPGVLTPERMEYDGADWRVFLKDGGVVEVDNLLDAEEYFDSIFWATFEVAVLGMRNYTK